MNTPSPSFFYLMELDGKPLGAPPPKMTRQEKLDWLAEQTRHHLMPQHDRLERLEELKRKKTM
jgi:hypothetical protein